MSSTEEIPSTTSPSADSTEHGVPKMADGEARSASTAQDPADATAATTSQLPLRHAVSSTTEETTALEHFYHQCLELDQAALFKTEAELREALEENSDKFEARMSAKENELDRAKFLRWLRTDADFEAEEDYQERDDLGMRHEIVKFVIRDKAIGDPVAFAFDRHAVRSFDNYPAPDWIKEMMSQGEEE